MKPAALLVVLAGTLTTSISFANLPLQIEGNFEQTGDCECREYSKTNVCDRTPLAVQALGDDSIGGTYGSSETGETIIDPKTGKKKDVNVWLYDVPGKDPFSTVRVREGDKLTYSVALNAARNGFNITINNLTLPQVPYVAKLVIPRDQAGGEMDGPAEIKTVVDEKSLVHTHKEVKYTAGDETAGPPVLFPIPGRVINFSLFQIVKVSDEVVELTQMHNNQIDKIGPIPPYSYNYGSLTCRLKRLK